MRKYLQTRKMLFFGFHSTSTKSALSIEGRGILIFFCEILQVFASTGTVHTVHFQKIYTEQDKNGHKGVYIPAPT